ncbi:MAG TPA: NAD(P)H-hydrate dehydratase [Ktedonobacteraceae bacterium]|nr:NAD(P)H-hydrate dehydratase [Ktedonobacteraceae bacterium]
MHIVTINEMRDLEAQAAKKYNLTSPILMENAGNSAAEILARRINEDRPLEGLNILLLIGPGNNGGDGLVMAHHMEKWDAHITLYRWKEHQLTVHGREIPERETASELENAISSTDYILDSVLGTGRSRPLPQDLRDLFARVQRERQQRPDLKLVAIDLPTGMNADTGEVDTGTIPYDITITLACPKQGFFFFPGREYLGELYVGDIGLPAELEEQLKTDMLTGSLIESILPKRPLNSNKGSFGKVMLHCGSLPYPGSAYLAGTSAARIGGGLITLSVTEQMLPIYASSFHEATFTMLPAEEEGSLARVKVLTEKLKGYKALLLGPGLGQSPYTREVIIQILEYLRSQPADERPHLIIDADGLNNLSDLEQWWLLLPSQTIITPHPGEMGRLCKGEKVSGGGIDRLDLARRKAQEWNLNLVLKGACTIVANPEGQTRMNFHSTPALATAGTGDVLAGMIAGLLAQGVKPYDAASAAVYLHTSAATLVTNRIGQAGLLASDLLPEIPRAIYKNPNWPFLPQRW